MLVYRPKLRKAQYSFTKQHYCPLKFPHAIISKDTVTFYIQQKVLKVSCSYSLRFEANEEITKEKTISLG